MLVNLLDIFNCLKKGLIEVKSDNYEYHNKTFIQNDESKENQNICKYEQLII